MRNELKDKMLSSFTDFHLPRYGEITNVGLYLEQTVKFINNYLMPLEGLEITSSMISNYVKQRLIANPIKKQYYTDHIAYLIFIAIIKTVVSLDDIRMMIGLQQDLCTVQKAYDYFCEKFEELLKSTTGGEEPGFASADALTDGKELLKNALNTVVSKIYLDKLLALYREERTLS